MSVNQKIVMVLGPTATGKTRFGVSLAAALNGEIVSADSRQVYRGLDIGSGKDSSEYFLPGGGRVPCHLIDVADPNDEYTLADFLTDSSLAIDGIVGRGRVPVVVGGTALYLHGLLCAYKLHGGAPDKAFREELRARSTADLRNTLAALDPENGILRKEPENRIRLIRAIEFAHGGDMARAREPDLPRNREYLILGVLRSRAEVRARIEARLRERLERENMLEEAVRLHEQGVPYERLEFFGLEYRSMALYLQGKITETEMFDSLLAHIRQFAKRQDSWFRKLERDGFPIYWLKPEETNRAEALARKFLAGEPLPEITFRLSGVNYGRTEK